MTDYSELIDRGRVKKGRFSRQQVEDCLRIARRDIETVEEGTSGPLVSLEARRLLLRYSLLSLLGGLESFLGRLELDLDGARIGLTGGKGGESKEPAGPLSLPGALPLRPDRGCGRGGR